MPSRSSQHIQLPYTPLPGAAADVAITCLTQLGFDRKGIVTDYKISSNSTSNKVIRIGALAFAHPSHRDLDDYAGITLVNAVNGYDDRALIPLLSETSALFHLIHRPDTFSFWASGTSIDQEKKRKKVKVDPLLIAQHIPYKNLSNVLYDYREDLQPQRIIDVKQGRSIFQHDHLSGLDPRQLSSWAEDIRSKPLVKHFEDAIHVLRTHQQHIPDRMIATISTQLLGLLILADTGVLGEEARISRPPLSRLLEKAHDKFPHFFERSLLDTTYQQAIEQAYNILERIPYTGFVPDMLGDLYTASYDRESRRQSGNYETPLHLARRILDNIPVEYLPPRERVIADVTCGWGSFLIAGYERLSRLDDSDEIPLQRSLYGNDNDYFFTQLAHLGLIYTTSRDDWRIDNEDIFQWQETTQLQPNIIVGGPPFAGSNKTTRSEEQEDGSAGQESGEKRTERANKFLEHAIQQLKPGGYLVYTMPRSFAASKAGPATRKKLLEECDILELWDLPREAFQGVTVRIMVIFAQKKLLEEKEVSANCVRIRTVQPNTLSGFKSRGIFTASALVTNQAAWHDAVWREEGRKAVPYIFDYTTILSQSSWKAITDHCVELTNIAKRTRGIGTSQQKKDWNVSSKIVPFLPNVDDILRQSYVINYQKASELLYPDDCSAPRLGSEDILQAKPKVILQYVQEARWGNRVKLAVENQGYYVSEHYYALIIRPNLWSSYLTVEALAAILDWDVSNAWIIEHMKWPGIPSQAIDTLPIPHDLNQEDCGNLAQAVQYLQADAQAGYSSQRTHLAREKIDTILKRAYHLDESTFERLRQIRRWDSHPSLTLDAQPDLTKADWFTSGIVDDVDAANGLITLWIDGFDDFQTVRIVPSMPGWLLRSGAAFLTLFPREYRRRRRIEPENIDWAYFRPQPYMYMSAEDLLMGISQHFATPSQ